MDAKLDTRAPLRVFDGESDDGEKCANCKFWLSGDKNQVIRTPDGQTLQGGLCRRFPPSMHAKMIMGPRGPQMDVAGQPLMAPFPLWGMTFESDWCGEFNLGLIRIPDRK